MHHKGRGSDIGSQYDRQMHWVLVLLVIAGRLVAAPPEPIQKPVKLLGFGEAVDQDVAKLTDIGITPSLTYYGVFQGDPIGGIQQRTAYSHLILLGVELNFEKSIPPACSSILLFAVRQMQVGPLPPKSKLQTSSMSKAASIKPANA